MARAVAVSFIFTQVGGLGSGWEVDRLAFMAMMVAALVVLSAGVGFAVVPAIRSVVKKYRPNPVQV